MRRVDIFIFPYQVTMFDAMCLRHRANILFAYDTTRQNENKKNVTYFYKLIVQRNKRKLFLERNREVSGRGVMEEKKKHWIY